MVRGVNRGDQRIDIAREVGRDLRGDERPPRDLRGQPVRQERVEVRQHLVLGLAGREHELIQQIIRAVTERELAELDAELGGQGPAEREPTRIRIEVKLRQGRRQGRDRLGGGA